MDYQTLYYSLYAIANGLCIFLLIYVLFKLVKSVSQSAANVAFRYTVFATILMLFVDFSWSLVDGKPGFSLAIVNKVLDVMSFTQAGLTGFFWLIFVQSRLSLKPFSRLKLLALLLPVVFVFGLSLVSCWTNWAFYLDAANVYHRGTWHFLIDLMEYPYFLVAFVMVLTGIRKTKNQYEKKQLYPLLLFFLLPIVAAVANIFVYGVPLLWPAFTVSIIMVYSDFRDNDVSRDALTGLNNRRELDKEMSHRLNDVAKAKDYYFMICDLNKFKNINDVFGHYEGDLALKEAAILLQKSVEGTSVFLARYGGDEFAMFGTFSSQEDVLALKKKTTDLFSSAVLGSKYSLDLCIGFARFGENGIVTARDLINAADKDLYAQKRHLG